jgi:hypothetical protein
MEAIEYFNTICQDANEQMDIKSLNKDGIKNYITHLPIKGENDGWPEEVYTIASNCLAKLYKYAIEMGYIKYNFLYKKFLHKEF